jgi:phosphoribosyl 1,2-cyclic phosphodiesterase
MKVRFWGVRGSFATPGDSFLRYGGNTTAVEVTADNGSRLLIDLGTGATELAKELMKGPFAQGQGQLPILLSHTHLDHIQGLPFFTPFFIKGNQICITGIESAELSLAQTLQSQLNPHYSPLYGLENLAAGVTIKGVAPGSSLPVPGFEVRAALMPHGRMAVLSFRITADGKTLVYMSDVEHPASGASADALVLARDADLLIHDAMFSDFEYQTRKGWGHSAISAAVTTAERSGARRLALFHHNPDATDAEIDALTNEAQSDTEIPLFAAAEGPAISV